MALAIFDLDETLIAADSDHLWGHFIAKCGLVDEVIHRQQNDEFYAQYQRGKLNVDAYLKFACSVLTLHSLKVLHEARDQFMREIISPIILDKGRQKIAEHRAKGDYPMIITSTIEFITAPIAQALDIETLIAPVPEFINGKYTGRISGVPSFGAGKVTRLKMWLESNQTPIAGSYFYSDSHNDLPLLRWIDHPIAVDPDEVLLKEAKEQGWEIISLRD